jgi:hypothetical protein
VGGGLALVAAIVAFLQYANMAAGPDADTLSDLTDRKESCQTSVRELASLGIHATRTPGATTAEYDEANWAAYQHDVRVQQAMYFYCADMPSSGVYTVTIKGKKNGKILAAIHNGKYSDGG